jgi:Cu2+-exporting ATPase
MRKFKITGMSCAACQRAVERAVFSLEKVRLASVNLLTSTLSVDADATDEEIINAVRRIGYGITKDINSRNIRGGDSKEEKRIMHRFIISILLLLPLMYITMGHMMLDFPLPRFLSEGHMALALSELILSFLILAVNYSIFKKGIAAFFRLAPNMDTLVSLGSLVSFFWSIYLVFNHSDEAFVHALYFESAAMILVIITLGKMLEEKAKGRSNDAIKSLLSLTPDSAQVLRDGNEITLLKEDILVGDVMVVRAGERISLDGAVIFGSATLDESSLTGEAMPVDKTEGCEVFASSVCISGFMHVRVTKLSNDTLISNIIRTVENAASEKAPIAKIADKVSGFFVPIVIVLAAFTSLVWFFIDFDVSHALMRGISVLVISCPCALGLATPVAIMVASGVGARHGILFKSAEALELVGRVKTVCFDKTGTLTEGAPTVTDVIFLTEDTDMLLSLAYSIENKSEHPLARAISRYSKEKGAQILELDDFETMTGYGVSAIFNGERVYCASFNFIKDKFTLPHSAVSSYETLAKAGKTPVFFALGNSLLGIFALFDTVKPEAAEVISSLRKMKLKTVLMSGDNEKSVAAIADMTGVDEFYAACLPNDKERIVSHLSKQSAVVMVGDGINDAPALIRADVGIAIGCGTDIAIESADAVLSSSSLLGILNAVRLSKATIRNIKQNLFWAFSYNIVGIPLAMGLFSRLLSWEMSPMFGALAMSLSSLLVVSNALRLNRVRLKGKEKYQNLKAKEDLKMEKIMKIDGIMCTHCEARIKSALEKTDGVRCAQVSHTNGTAFISLNKEISDEVLIDAVSNAGYTVKSIK